MSGMKTVSRRHFHQLTAGLAGTVLLHDLAAQEPVKTKRIIIAGAGIGGLCCAYELMERGHDVVVLEA